MTKTIPDNKIPFKLTVDTADKWGYKTLVEASLLKTYNPLGVVFSRTENEVFVYVPEERLDLVSKIKSTVMDYVHNKWKKGHVSIKINYEVDTSRIKDLENQVSTLKQEVIQTREEIHSKQEDLSAAEELLFADPEKLKIYKKKSGLVNELESSKKNRAPRKIKTSVHKNTYDSAVKLSKQYKKEVDELEDKVNEVEKKLELKEIVHKEEISKYKKFATINEILDKEAKDYRINTLSARAIVESMYNAIASQDLTVKQLDKYLGTQKDKLEKILGYLIIPNGKRHSNEGIQDLSRSPNNTKKNGKPKYGVTLHDAVYEAILQGKNTDKEIIRYIVDQYHMPKKSLHPGLQAIRKNPNSKMTRTAENVYVIKKEYAK